jgi:hypothetical protein
MLDESTRTAILRLHEANHGTRAIAKALEISRGAVREVLREGTTQVPRIEREELAARYHELILEYYAKYKGHLGRVHEEITAEGAELSYPALTAYCRRHGIGHEPAMPAGHYDFAPGEEMQHDTSPHRVRIRGVLKSAQTASLVLCYSRRLYFQLYPRFRRFECKVFLTDAVVYMDGAAAFCMIDNTHVVVATGSGQTMVPAPEMAAFAERYGYEFAAHEKGDANRSARVEGPFNWIEKNFLEGRDFEDWEHVNREAVAWCDRKNAEHSRKLRASRQELYATERLQLRRLPIWVPEVYELHHRHVDLEGYITLHTTRYSVPYQLIGRVLEIREQKDRILVFDGPRQVAEHRRRLESDDVRVTQSEHRPPRGQGRCKQEGPPPELARILEIEPSLASYVDRLRTRSAGRGTLALRRLLHLLRDYPRQPFLCALQRAQEHGLFDLDRLERMVLDEITDDYFVVPTGRDDEDDDDER